MIDISQSRMFVRKVIGASFAFNKNKFKVPYYFKYNLDRRDGTLLSGGDTEFCERIADIGGKVVYTPFTHANHVVSKERISLYWILKRSYYGGLSRALRGGKIKTFTIKKTFLYYAAIVLIIPTYAVGYLIGKMRYA